MPKPAIGHNSGDDSILDAPEGDSSLRTFIERIERLEEEKKGLGDDVKDVYSEAKGQGYDTKIMRVIVALRKMDKSDRDERDALIETYRAALGMA